MTQGDITATDPRAAQGRVLFAAGNFAEAEKLFAP